MHSFYSLRDKVDSALFALSPPRSPLCSIGKLNCGFVLHTNWTPVQFGGCAALWNSLFDVAWAVDTGDCFCTRLGTFLLVILSPCIVLCLHFLSHAIEILRQIGFEAAVSSFSLCFLERKIQNFFQTHKLADCQTQLWLKGCFRKVGGMLSMDGNVFLPGKSNRLAAHSWGTGLPGSKKTNQSWVKLESHALSWQHSSVRNCFIDCKYRVSAGQVIKVPLIQFNKK